MVESVRYLYRLRPPSPSLIGPRDSFWQIKITLLFCSLYLPGVVFICQPYLSYPIDVVGLEKDLFIEQQIIYSSIESLFRNRGKRLEELLERVAYELYILFFDTPFDIIKLYNWIIINSS